MPEIRNSNNDSPAYDDWLKAKRLYEQALYEDCFYALFPGFVRDLDYTPLYALAAEVSGKLAAEGARELFSEVAHGRADAGVFDELGNMYFEGRQWHLAAMFLHKSLRLEPDNSGARYDLGLSYVHLHQLQDAVNVLEQDKTSDFWCKYLWYKVKIFQGNTHRLATDIAGFEALTHVRHTQGDSEVEILKAAELREV